MFGYKNTTGKTLILASVLALTGGVAVAQRGGQGPGNGDRSPQRQGDREGNRQQGERGERGPRGEQGQRGERAQRGEQGQRGERSQRGERGERGDRMRRDMSRRLFADMDLSADQKEQIHVAMKKFGDERKAWHETNRDQFQSLRDKMREAHQAKDPDAVKAVHEQIKALMDSAPKPDAAHDEVRALLNQEQQATFDERVAKMRQRMDQWKEQRGDGPPMGRNGFAPGEDGPPRDANRPEGRRPRGGKLFGNLNLTDEQKASLRQTMQSDLTREEKKAAVRELLNDEQRAQFDQNIEKMRKYREERKGERGERGKRGERDRRDRDGDRGRGGSGGERDGSGGRGGSQLDL